MPDDEQQGVQAEEVVPAETSEVDISPEVGEVSEEGEPSGDHPGFVRGRKEYRIRKQTERELLAEREARIRAEERAATIEAVGRRAPSVPTGEVINEGGNKRLTREQIHSSVNDGEMDQLTASDLLAEIKIEEVMTRERNRAAVETSNSRQLESALGQINQYIDIAPSLGTHQHPRFGEVSKEFNRLVGEGYINSPKTELLALRTVFGSIERFRRQSGSGSERRNSNHSELNSGGISQGGTPNDKILRTSKGEAVPQRYVNHWRSRGYTAEEMKREAEYLSKDQITRK
jgi:hypothetical protein